MADRFESQKSCPSKREGCGNRRYESWARAGKNEAKWHGVDGGRDIEVFDVQAAGDRPLNVDYEES